MLTMQVTADLTVELVTNPEFDFLMSTKDVAHGYGISDGTLRRHQMEHKDELVEGKHFVKGVQILNTLAKNLQPHAVYWTKAGIVRLGFL